MKWTISGRRATVRAAFGCALALAGFASHPALGVADDSAPPANVASADWGTQSNSLHGQVGQRFKLSCPANGALSSRLWGTDLYTDDSSICTAAVHASLISTGAGGTVTIEIRSGAASYRGTTRNGVVSRDYGTWGGSFAFVGSATAVAPVSQVPSNVAAADWGTQSNSLHGQVGQRFKLSCPANGALSSRLWGTDLYTDDSSICTAAVHAGLISTTSGGTITIEIRPGAASYRGTTRNGVASSDYGTWSGSFAFVH